MLKNRNGWFLQHHELYPLLGFEAGQHLPADGFEAREVQGVMFKCDPALAGRHRLRYLCDCNRWIPFGRAAQHQKGQKHQNRRV
jgi:hypothetical protein